MPFYSAPKSVEIAAFDGGPCPVCGAAGGNCKGESDFEGAAQILPPKKDDPFATFTVSERVYAHVTVNGRTRRKLLYPQGARIRPEEAKRLGLM
jgi:hypothetical protein